MDPEMSRREQLLRWLFALLALVVPMLLVYEVDYQSRTPTSKLPLDWQTGVILEIPKGSFAELAGLMAGDVIVSIDDTPFPQCNDLIVGNYSAQIERDGQLLTLKVPIPFVKAGLLTLICASIIALSFWGLGIVLLLRRFRRADTRLLFVAVQVFAIAILLLLTNPPMWTRPIWMAHVSIACFHLSALFLLHYALTFPVLLGTPRQRRWGLSLLYGLTGLLFLIRVASSETLWARLSIFLGASPIGATVGVLSYVYFRRADPDARRRLRLIFLGTVLAIALPTLYSLFIAISGTSYQATFPWMSLFFPFAPLCYFYAIVRHNLFGIDRLLNRALVYVLLSLSILVLYLGPFLLIYRFLPDDLAAQLLIVAGLTLLVGLGFNWARERMQRLVDRLFYGGWYDYAGVVETVSSALSRTLDRQQLIDVLIRRVPEMMQLREGSLWVGEADAVPQQEVTPPQLRFLLSLGNQTCGLWTVGARRDGDDFSAADRRILQTLARQAEIALSNVLLVETLQRRLDEIREAQHQLLRSREEERARVARDLHDGPIQALVGLNMQLGLLLSSSLDGDAPLSGELRAMRGEVRELLTNLRQVCTELRPPMLDTLGLGAALRALAEEWSAQHDVAFRLDLPTDAALRSLPDEVAVNLYRVVQEALANVARHAEARQVTLHLAREGSRLSLTVQDDGRGFSVPAGLQSLTGEGHFGLVGMEERVGLIGGTLTLDSAPGQGMRVCVVWQGDEQGAG